MLDHQVTSLVLGRLRRPKLFEWLHGDRDRLRAELEKVRRSKTAIPPALRSRQLAFMHIGKTAGTSVQDVLIELMAEAETFHASLPQFDAVSQGHLDHYDLVIGHFTHRHVAKLRPDRFLLTFLREPVDRVVSNYHFLRTQGDSVDPASQRAIDASRRLDLRAFLLCEDPLVRMYTSNHQCRVLAFDHRPGTMGDSGDLLAAAKRNVEQFDFVGIVEHFDASLGALSDALHLASPLKTRRLNVNVERARLLPPTFEDVEIARSLNEADTVLYWSERKRFEASWAAACRPRFEPGQDNRVPLRKASSAIEPFAA